MNPLLDPLPQAVRPFLAKRPHWAWAAHFGWKFAEKWGADECPLFAAALAFFGLLSLFPITLAAVALLAHFLAGNPQIVGKLQVGLQNWVQGFFPGAAGNEISRQLAHVVTGLAGRSDPTAIGVLAIVPLVWSGRAYFDTLATVLNNVWPGTAPRSFLSHQLTLWGTFLGAGALWVLSTVSSFALRLAHSLGDFFPEHFNAQIRIATSFWDWTGRFVAWLLTVVMFWLLYHFLPNRQAPQRRRVVVGAAFLAALLWEAAKLIFSVFLGNLSRYETTYGGVAGVVLTLLWIYFSSLIILFGAEAAAAFEATCAAAHDAGLSHEPTEPTSTEPEPDEDC
jgi:membrane protein